MSYSSPDVNHVVVFVQVDCHRASGVDISQEFDVHVFYPLFLERRQYLLSVHCVVGLLVDERDAPRVIVTSPSVGVRHGCDLSLRIFF